MAEPIGYDEIPIEIRDLLDELYDHEGAVIWWNGRNRLLSNQRAYEVWDQPDGPDRVTGLLNALCDGVFF